jgi:hypothetical protein
VSEVEAVAVQFEDMDEMSEALEEFADQPLGSEHGCPLVEWQITGDQCAAGLLALTEDLE